MSDWNKTEVITVPKGFYGWRTKGRLRYEDKVFRFPVGQATSLPAPVVEHLRKLIELPEEERPEQPHKYSANSTFTTDAEGNPVWSPVDVTALTDEMLTTEAKAELAALCPEIFADPDVKILYDPDRTEIAHSEFRDNLDIEVAYFPNVTKINPFAFYGCTNLLAVVFPKLIKLQAGNAFDYCTSLKYLGLPEVTHFSNGCFQHCSSLEAFSHKAISVDAFGECTNLTTITLPEAITVGGFVNCTSLTEINLPVASYFNNNAFMGCTSLTKVCLPDEKNSTIYFNDEIFMNCSNLTALILPSEKVAQYRTVRTGLFTNTPIAEGTGYIYVPASLIESYKNAEPSRYGVSWADYAAQFRAIEDYPEICDPTMDEPLTKGEAAALIDSKLEGAGGSGSGNIVIYYDGTTYTCNVPFDKFEDALKAGSPITFIADNDSGITVNYYHMVHVQYTPEENSFIIEVYDRHEQSVKFMAQYTSSGISEFEYS